MSLIKCPGCGAERYTSWRAEPLDRAPEIVRKGGVGAEWRRSEYLKEFGREPIPQLRVIEGGKA